MKRSTLNRLVSFPLLPLLVAVMLPLQLVQANPTMFAGGASLTRTVAVCIMGALLITVVLGLLLRNFHRAGILATIVVGLLLFGSSAVIAGAQFFKTELNLAVPPSVLLFAIFGAATLLLSRVRFPPVITHAGNAATVAILIYTTAAILLAAPVSPGGPENHGTVAESHAVQHFSDASAPQERPDIIHIVLDGYSRADVLSETYRFDNSEFLADLARLGFVVADEAVAPYNQTLLTMSSIFRGDYLESAGDGSAASVKAYRKELSEAFQANPVMTALRQMGYRIASTKSEYPPLILEGTVMPAPAHGLSMSHLERALYEFSGVSIVVEDLGLSAVVGNNSAVEIRSALDASRRERGVRPYFHYVHLLAPHPPFDVDSRGRPVSKAGILNRLADGSHFHAHNPVMKMAYRDGYVQKLTFINTEITAFLKTVISEREGRLVILLHGDHGGGMHMDQENVAATCARERFLPLLAVYSSDGKLQQSLPPETNLVNLYRIVFNSYFGTALADLPAISSFSPHTNPAIHIPVAPEALEAACSDSG